MGLKQQLNLVSPLQGFAPVQIDILCELLPQKEVSIASIIKIAEK